MIHPRSNRQRIAVILQEDPLLTQLLLFLVLHCREMRVQGAVERQASRQYLTIVHPASSNSRQAVSVLLHRRCTDAAALRAFVHALVAAVLLSEAGRGASSYQEQIRGGANTGAITDGGHKSRRVEQEVEESTEGWMEARFDRFVDAVSRPTSHFVSCSCPRRRPGTFLHLLSSLLFPLLHSPPCMCARDSLRYI